MNHDPHFIPPAERAEGEPGEHGCLRAEAEEREAEESAPGTLESYRAKLRGRAAPPNQPTPTQEEADRISRGEYQLTPEILRAPLKAHFDQALRRGKWLCFGFSEEQDRRCPIHSPWREGLAWDNKGGMTNRNRPTHLEVLFYLAGAEPPATPDARRTKRSPGRKEIDDSAELVAARELIAAGIGDHKAAEEIAGKRYPDQTNLRENLARRVYRKLRKGD